MIIKKRHPQPVFCVLPLGVVAAEDEDEEEGPPPVFMNTVGLTEAFRLASSATLNAISMVSPQCLHFLASNRTDSAQKGHFLKFTSSIHLLYNNCLSFIDLIENR